MITANYVANTILHRAFSEGVAITPMKLQKLIYIIYKVYYKEIGKKIFTEPFSAWRRGPVIPTVYNEFKNYGARPIDDYSLESDGKTYTTINLETSNDFRIIFDKVWREYGYETAYNLSEMTHLSDGAWDKAVKNDTYILTDDDIREEPPYEGKSC